MSGILEHPLFQRLPRIVPQPSDEELAWLAGFIDGEGTIALTVHRRSQSVATTFSVTNTNLDSLGRARVLLRAITGRDVLPQQNSNEGRPAFTLSIQRHYEVDLAVRALRPRLVGKRKQADLMLAYLAECSAALRGTHRHQVDTPQMRARRLDYAGQMRDLNRRYAPGQWDALHPNVGTVTASSIRAMWRDAEAQSSDKDWDAIRTLLTLRG